MKLKFPFFKDKPPEPTGMMTQPEVERVHQMLVAIVTEQTPIRFSKLKAREPNPLQMMAEVFAFVLKHPHGNQVAKVIEDLRSKLEQWAKEHQHEAEQAKILDLIAEQSKPPSLTIVPPPPTNRHGAA